MTNVMTKVTTKAMTKVTKVMINDLLSADLPTSTAGGRWSDVLVLVVQHLGAY